MEDQAKLEFDQLKDAEDIHNSLENKEVEKVVEIICSRSKEQRQKIAETYVSSFGTELSKAIESKLSGDVKNLILGCLLSKVDFDAGEINRAIKGAGTDEDLLSEIIATRPSRHITHIRDRYKELYGETLDEAIQGDTSKYYKKILIAIIQGKRSDNPYPNSQKMKDMVDKLKGSDGKYQNDFFIQYFSTCSYGEICTICRLFESTYKENVLDVIKSGMDKDAYDFIKLFLHYISDSGTFFAEKLHNFKEKDLTRILISRSEVNMDEIRDAYKELYKTDLIDDLKEKTKGEYQLGLTILAQK